MPQQLDAQPMMQQPQSCAGCGEAGRSPPARSVVQVIAASVRKSSDGALPEAACNSKPQVATSAKATRADAEARRNPCICGGYHAAALPQSGVMPARVRTPTCRRRASLVHRRRRPAPESAREDPAFGSRREVATTQSDVTCANESPRGRSSSRLDDVHIEAREPSEIHRVTSATINHGGEIQSHRNLAARSRLADACGCVSGVAIQPWLGYGPSGILGILLVLLVVMLLTRGTI